MHLGRGMVTSIKPVSFGGMGNAQAQQSKGLITLASLHGLVSVRSRANWGWNMALLLSINSAHCMSERISKPLQKTLHRTSPLGLT